MRGVKGSSPICSIDGCDTVAYGRGWCQKHWARWRDTGRTDLRSVEERFWEKVHKTEMCWLWTGAGSPDDYGRFGIDGRMHQAHRLAYEWLVGPIPDGLTLDHVRANGCTSRACVKVLADEFGPAHLEPVTQGENNRRGDGVSGLNARKTHCHNGHPFDEANTYPHPSGGRDCRTCRSEASAASRARREVAS